MGESVGTVLLFIEGSPAELMAIAAPKEQETSSKNSK